MAASQLGYQEIRYRLRNHAVFRLSRNERVVVPQDVLPITEA
jgi:hypothetical protein